jgi:hypothetical protein
MLDLGYDYESCIRNSEKVSWRLDDVLPPGTRLDFQRPFLPAALAGVDPPDFLPALEGLRLNQLTGNAYVNLFAFVEEYILALAVQLAQAEMFGDHKAIRALVRFAEEEAKHQSLFHRYSEAFREGFGAPCEVLESASAVAGVILGKTPIAVLVTTLHIELMTQAHYVESVRDNTSIDPLVASLLHHHWLEEAQHARIDALELDKLLDHATPEQISQGIEQYLSVLEAFDGLLRQQAEMDLRALDAHSGRPLPPEQAEQVVHSQHRGYRRTFLVAGMTNKAFADIVKKMSVNGAAQVVARAATFAA